MAGKENTEPGRELLYYFMLGMGLAGIVALVPLSLWSPGWWPAAAQTLAQIVLVWIVGMGIGGLAEMRCRREEEAGRPARR